MAAERPNRQSTQLPREILSRLGQLNLDPHEISMQTFLMPYSEKPFFYLSGKNLDPIVIAGVTPAEMSDIEEKDLPSSFILIIGKLLRFAKFAVRLPDISSNGSQIEIVETYPNQVRKSIPIPPTDEKSKLVFFSRADSLTPEVIIINPYDSKAEQLKFVKSLRRNELGIPDSQRVTLSDSHCFEVKGKQIQVMVLVAPDVRAKIAGMKMETYPECISSGFRFNITTGRSWPFIHIVSLRDYGERYAVRYSSGLPGDVHKERTVANPKRYPGKEGDIPTLIVYLDANPKGGLITNCAFENLPQGPASCGLFDEKNRLLGEERASSPTQPLPAELAKLAVKLHEEKGVRLHEDWRGFARTGPSSAKEMITYLKDSIGASAQIVTDPREPSSKISYSIQIDSERQLIIIKRTHGVNGITYSKDRLVISPDGKLEDLIYDHQEKKWTNLGLGLSIDDFWPALCLVLSQAEKIPTPKVLKVNPTHRPGPEQSHKKRPSGAKRKRGIENYGLE